MGVYAWSQPVPTRSCASGMFVPMASLQHPMTGAAPLRLYYHVRLIRRSLAWLQQARMCSIPCANMPAIQPSMLHRARHLQSLHCPAHLQGAALLASCSGDETSHADKHALYFHITAMPAWVCQATASQHADPSATRSSSSNGRYQHRQAAEQAVS